MIDENIERLNKIEEKYKTGKIDIDDLVNGCYNIGLDAAKKVVKESDSLPCISDFAESLLKQGYDLYERAKQARSEKEEGLLAVESMTYKRIGKELMAHCR